jgi:DNA-binding YbaB/EbfC family protein
MAKGNFRGGMPSMGMGGGNMSQLLQQAQKMQREVEKVQEEVKNSTIDATSGGGAVKVTINGIHEIKTLKIDPKVVDPEDVEMLQDLIIAACNEASRKLEEFSTNKMNEVTGGVKMPF